MKKIRVVQTAELKSKKDLGIVIIDLHSQLYQVAAGYEILHDKRSKRELRRGKPVRWAFTQLNRLRESIPPSVLLRDVSAYYQNFASGWGGYWIHGFIPVADFLSAIEKAVNLALSGEDFTRPLRELNRRFPYQPEQYCKSKDL